MCWGHECSEGARSAGALAVYASCWLAGAAVQVWPRLFFLECRLRCREPCRQQPERRAAYVVEPDPVAELDGLRIAAMFAADADLEGGPRVASLGDGSLDQRSHASLIERGKRILLEDAGLEICGQEVVDVVARDAVGGLRQVV